MFYVAEALLLGKGLAFSSHSAVIAGIGEHFARAGLIDPRLHRYLMDGHVTRTKSDYDVTATISEAQAAEQIAHAEEFMQAAERFLEGSGMGEIRRIQDQLKRSLEGEAWHGPSLLEVLHGVTPDHAKAKPVTAAHSIWEIVLHVTAWMTAVRRRIDGEALELSPEQDWPPVSQTGAGEWSAVLKALKTAYADLHGAISRLHEDRLKDIVPGKDYSVYFLLHGVVQHNLYHAGQIMILRKALSGP